MMADLSVSLTTEELMELLILDMSPPILVSTEPDPAS